VQRISKENAPLILNVLQANPLCDIDDDFLVQMYSTLIKTKEPEKLKSLLYEKYKIEIPVMRQDDKVFLRYSVQVFNTQKDIDVLANALRDIIATTNLIEL